MPSIYSLLPPELCERILGSLVGFSGVRSSLLPIIVSVPSLDRTFFMSYVAYCAMPLLSTAVVPDIGGGLSALGNVTGGTVAVSCIMRV